MCLLDHPRLLRPSSSGCLVTTCVPFFFLYFAAINELTTLVSIATNVSISLTFACTLASLCSSLRYVAPEQVPVQYGGLSREGEQEFSTEDPVTEVAIKPATKHTVEFPISEVGEGKLINIFTEFSYLMLNDAIAFLLQPSLLVWELRVVGWDVSYGAEFLPSAEGGYTVIVQKTRKLGPADEPVISNSYSVGEAGKIVLTIDNQSSKKKKILLYRSKTKPISD